MLTKESTSQPSRETLQRIPEILSALDGVAVPDPCSSVPVHVLAAIVRQRVPDPPTSAELTRLLRAAGVPVRPRHGGKAHVIGVRVERKAVAA